MDESYDRLGRRIRLAYPNGITTTYSYDNDGRLLTLQNLNSSNAVVEGLTYAYDPAGNRISMNRQSIASLPLPNPVTSATYNDANQMLIFAPQTGTARNITYDSDGNMTSVTNTCGTTNFTWDARNRLAGISGFDGKCSPVTASFKYDALGRRIEKTISGRTIQYLYDGSDIIQEIENGQVTVNYIRTLNIDEPVARVGSDGMVRYYQKDALGSIIALTDDKGTSMTTYSYDPFGNVTISGEISDNPFQYTGRENDGTGLYYYRGRYYSPDLQRFISLDPIGLKGGINLYAYVGNNPINYVDPFGLEICIPWFSEYGLWENIGDPVANDYVQIVTSNVTGPLWCNWTRTIVQRQGRDVFKKKLCCGKSVCVGVYCQVRDAGKTRDYQDLKTIIGPIRTSVMSGDAYGGQQGLLCCTDPWTGEVVCKLP